MFTDWTQTNPHYFFFRGAIYGFVLATMLFKWLIPTIKDKFFK